VTGDGLSAAVAAGALATEETHRSLLQSIVDVARAIFGARASSIFLYDEPTDELVFAAVSGEGSADLVGRRIPSSTGVAGWVLVTRQSLVVEDLASDPRFARTVAEDTGYVPDALIAVPLLREDRVLGVLEVLDRPHRAGFALAEIDLLSLFADQASIGIDLLQHARRAQAVVVGEDELAVISRLATALLAAEGPSREAALELLRSVEKLLARS
jgi:GAF domain-containing protein